MITVDHAIDRLFRILVTTVFGLILLFAAFSLVRVAGVVPVGSTIVSVNNTPDYAMGGIQGETVLQQTFEAKWPIEKIGIKMATYDRKNPGEIYLRVYRQASGETLSQSVKSAENLVDNDFNVFTLEREIPPDGETYVIEVSGSAPNVLQSAGVWCSFSDTFPDGDLTVNEFETDGDLVFFLVSSEERGTGGAKVATVAWTVLTLLTALGWILFTRYENRRHS